MKKVELVWYIAKVWEPITPRIERPGYTVGRIVDALFVVSKGDPIPHVTCGRVYLSSEDAAWELLKGNITTLL